MSSTKKQRWPNADAQLTVSFSSVQDPSCWDSATDVYSGLCIQSTPQQVSWRPAQGFCPNDSQS